MATQKSSESGRFGTDNLTYDLIAAIHEKAQGLEAFEHLQDAQSGSEARQCFEELQRQDRENIQRLERILANRLSKSQGQRAA